MIEVYESVLSKQMCDNLIQTFEKSDKDVSYHMFQQLEIGTPIDLVSLVDKVGNHYLNKYDPTKMTPKKRATEGFRIKKYTPNIHSFPWHVDSNSFESCTRYLAFLFYLNDNDAGTKFSDFIVEAKCGSILVFPPMWMFPHEGVMPTTKPKYIMSTYFHYVR
jgi:hypothetical protein